MTEEKNLDYSFVRDQAERLVNGEMDWAVVLAYLAAMAAVAMIAFVTL